MPTGVLLSGGLDSAVLLAEEAACDEVQPIYVSVGFPWEAAEREALRLFFDAFTRPTIRPLAALTVDMTDVYPAVHWARAGQAPAYHTPDEDVYIPGRNVVLLGKAGVFCAMAGLDRLVIGTLDHNPFPDATSAFREAMARALSLGLAHPLTIAAPYAGTGKAEVIARGERAGVPLAFTLSCMNARVGGSGFPRHCGICSKCRERHEAFVMAGVTDTTDYADRTFID
ncbi:MAG: 7-cyano-7-deazaguanine synthase [Acidobacteria bacterium]|nr:7-cyano-7-deazaguanine synthase [Acidobacteriota bacterium]